MKSRQVSFAVSLAIMLAFGVHADGQGKLGSEPSAQTAQAFALGVAAAKSLLDRQQQLERQGVQLDKKALVEGFVSGFDNPEVLGKAELAQAQQGLQERIRQAAQQQAEQKSQQSRAQNTAFLAEFAQQQGVKVMPSGLEYKVLTQGKGSRTVSSDDKVTLHYKGTLPDGTVFDQSKPDQPVSFYFREAPQGWQEALVKMHEGDIWQIALPPAIGSRLARPEGTPPNSVLVYELALLKVD